MKKHTKLFKFAIVFVLTFLIFFIIQKCTKAEGEKLPAERGTQPETTAEPSTPSPTSVPDLWDDWELPDWLQTEFDFVTPSPSRPPADYAVPQDIVVPDVASLQGFNSDWQYKSYLNLWYQYLSNGDSSVWYFKSMTQTQIAVGSSSLYRPYAPWRDNVGYQMFTEQNYLRFLNGSNSVMNTSSTYGCADVSISDFNISFFDVANLANSHQVPANYRVIYYFAMNKLYPKFYNSPSWFADIGLTEDLLYDLLVTPSVEIVLRNGISQTIIYEPISLRQLYSGYTFDMDLNSIFVGSDSYVSEFRFNFSIPFFSGDWIGMQKYRQYLIDHPEITGHIPFYVYWDSSSSASSSGKGVFTFFRGYAVSELVDNRNWLTKLFIPSMAEMYELFDYYLPNINDDGTFGFVIRLRQTIFDTVMNPAAARDVTLTVDPMSIPIQGRQFTFFNGYTYNFSETLRDTGLDTYIRLAFNLLLTFLFVNSVVSMVINIFDIHYFDGVSE